MSSMKVNYYNCLGYKTSPRIGVGGSRRRRSGAARVCGRAHVAARAAPRRRPARALHAPAGGSGAPRPRRHDRPLLAAHAL